MIKLNSYMDNLSLNMENKQYWWNGKSNEWTII